MGNSRNHFIIFATVIVVVIIVAFISLLATIKDTTIVDTLTKQYQENATNKIVKISDKTNNKIKIFINPAHNAATKGHIGYLGYEFYMTLRLAQELTKILDEDSRFEYELSRNTGIYSRGVKEYLTNNYGRLIDFYNNDLEKRDFSITRYQTLELYSIRNYAIENDFDLFLSLHFNYEPYISKRNNTEGFHLIVSPYNGQFQASMQIANTISKKMREKYKIAKNISFDYILPESVWKFYSKEDLIQNGIALKGTILLGDKFEFDYYNQKFNPDDIPSVSISAGYIHDWKLGPTKALRELAEKIYEGLVETYFN